MITSTIQELFIPCVILCSFDSATVRNGSNLGPRTLYGANCSGEIPGVNFRVRAGMCSFEQDTAVTRCQRSFRLYAGVRCSKAL